MRSVVFVLLLTLPAMIDLTPAVLSSLVEPVPPTHVVIGNAVMADVTVNSRGKVSGVSITQGEPPFAEEAAHAIRQWQFQPAEIQHRAVESQVGVLTIFRPAAFGSSAVGGPALGYKAPGAVQPDQPPMPKFISDPGYPVNSTGGGVVILELKIAPNGSIDDIRVVRNIPALTDAARAAVQSWRYMPAQSSGSAVHGTLIVAVSFLRPVVPVNP
jgi:TonB family protein